MRRLQLTRGFLSFVHKQSIRCSFVLISSDAIILAPNKHAAISLQYIKSTGEKYGISNDGSLKGCAYTWQPDILAVSISHIDKSDTDRQSSS